jgi:hypothetical protein
VIGVPHALAQRRIAARFLAPLRAAAAAIIGAELPAEVVIARDWLRTHRDIGRREFPVLLEDHGA